MFFIKFIKFHKVSLKISIAVNFFFKPFTRIYITKLIDFISKLWLLKFDTIVLKSTIKPKFLKIDYFK